MNIKLYGVYYPIVMKWIVSVDKLQLNIDLIAKYD